MRAKVTRTHAEHLHTACTLSIIEMCLALDIAARWIAIIVSALMLTREIGGTIWFRDDIEPQLDRITESPEVERR